MHNVDNTIVSTCVGTVRMGNASSISLMLGSRRSSRSNTVYYDRRITVDHTHRHCGSWISKFGLLSIVLVLVLSGPKTVSSVRAVAASTSAKCTMAHFIDLQTLMTGPVFVVLLFVVAWLIIGLIFCRLHGCACCTIRRHASMNVKNTVRDVNSVCGKYKRLSIVSFQSSHGLGQDKPMSETTRNGEFQTQCLRRRLNDFDET